MDTASSERGATSLGRYVIYDEIAAGGMATVHFGRLLGDAGFARTVAIKRLHPQYAKDPEFATMFMDEARVTSRIRHPNVVTTLDVVAQDGELFVIMEYVHGEPLSRLIRASSRRQKKLPPRVVGAIMAGALHGLHAAHEATDELGRRLDVVHRDVSPHNILVGTDGVARVLDFGIAKAAGRAGHTREGEIKGKFAYMPPEQLHGEPIDRRADIYAAGVVLWEALTGERLFHGAADVLDLQRLLAADADPPSSRVSGIPARLDQVAMRALEREPEGRYATSRAMAIAIEEALSLAPPSEVSALVEDLVGDSLARRAGKITAMEAAPMPNAGKAKSKPSASSFFVDTTLIMAIEPPKPVIADERTLPLDDKDVIVEPPASAARDPMPSQSLAEEQITVPLPPNKRKFLQAASDARMARDRGGSRSPTMQLRNPLFDAASRRRATVIAAGVVILGIVVALLMSMSSPLSRALFGSAEEAGSGSDKSESESLRPPPDPGAVTAGARQPPASAELPLPPEPPPGAEPTPSAEASKGAPSRSSRPPSPSPSPSPPLPRPLPRATANPCNPPFVIDAQGHKRYKRECL